MRLSLRRWYGTAELLAIAAISGCSDGTPTQVISTGLPGLHVISPAASADTIDAAVSETITVEVRDDLGHPMSGVIVNIEPRPPFDAAGRNVATSCATVECNTVFSYRVYTSVRTDSSGRVVAKVRRGAVAGRIVLLVYAPTTGAPDSVVYQVNPGNATRVVAPAVDTTLDIGATATFRGRVLDRYGNVRAEAPTLSVGNGSAMTLDAATGIATGRELGMQWLYARQGTFTDSTRVRVLPPGRLVVWSTAESVHLVNVNGTDQRQVILNITSASGVFPVFNATRQGITLQHNSIPTPGLVNEVTRVDTTGFPRREIDRSNGFSPILTTRQLLDGAVLLVGTRSGQSGVWRVSPDNSVTFTASLPGFISRFGGADISHDGTRVLYLSFANGRPELRHLTIATGAWTTLVPLAQAPRWSRQDDKIAYLMPANGTTFPTDLPNGVPMVMNADGSGQRQISPLVLSAGLAWSPDAAYLVGQSAVAGVVGLQVIRVSDGVSVPLRFRSADGNNDFRQPDWR